MRSILTDRLKGKPTRANFRTGHLTVCTLVPMRSIPHKVVCLLGLDDGSFPRHIERDGDDLTAHSSHASATVTSAARTANCCSTHLLAARDHLVITYTGRDERSNLRRPPAVPVGELLDVVDHTVRVPRGQARDAIIVTHPLQPFDPATTSPGSSWPGSPGASTTVHLDGAKAALRRARPRHRSFPTRCRSEPDR